MYVDVCGCVWRGYVYVCPLEVDSISSSFLIIFISFDLKFPSIMYDQCAKWRSVRLSALTGKASPGLFTDFK